MKKKFKELDIGDRYKLSEDHPSIYKKKRDPDDSHPQGWGIGVLVNYEWLEQLHYEDDIVWKIK